MKSCTLALAFLSVCLVALAEDAAELSSRLDTVDIQQVLDNPRILKNYVNCIIDKGPCTAETREVKKYMSEYIVERCKRCSPKLRANVKKVILTMREKYPNDLEKVFDKFDPKREHTAELEKFLKE